MCACVCIKDVVMSTDSWDNGRPYGLMSGSLARIYVVCVNAMMHIVRLLSSQADFRKTDR